MYPRDQEKFIEFEEGEGVVGKETIEVNMVMLWICILMIMEELLNSVMLGRDIIQFMF